MGIPESQLETWSHQGAVTTAKATHESIRNALDSYEWPDDVKFEVYLQGSYKNDTNIRGDSDVDVVVQLNSTFYNNLSKDEKKNLRLKPTSYGWSEFRSDVISALRDYYDSSTVSEGNKSVKIKANSGRLAADVVVCVKYVKYVNLKKVAEGITFWTIYDNRQIVNYPKLHYNNGVKKNAETDGWYKPNVRVFKNARTHLINHNVIAKDLAPSYFLECLIYNLPDKKFGSNYQEMFCDVVNWLAKANFDGFMCQNEQLLLFGNTSEQWSIKKAKRLVQKLMELWNHW